jgi:hypothetical protein
MVFCPSARKGIFACGQDEVEDHGDEDHGAADLGHVRDLEEFGDGVHDARRNNHGRDQQHVAPHEQDKTGACEHLEPVEVRIPASRTHDMHGGINGHTSSEVAEPMHC